MAFFFGGGVNNNSAVAFDHRTNWNERYSQLERYKAQHGDCEVPRMYKAADGLATWVRTQRALKKTGKLTRDESRRLERIGFRFEVPKQKRRSWDQCFNDLREYRAKHGHCDVPRGDPKDHHRLGNWVKTQRTSHRRGELSADRAGRLERIGFSWRVLSRWEDRYKELLGFRREHGHADVPWNCPRLGGWVMTQRKRYKRREMSEARIALLEDIGFEWEGKKSRSRAVSETGDESSMDTRGRAAEPARGTKASSPAMVSDGDDARVEVMHTETSGRAADSSGAIGVSSPTMASDGSDAQVETLRTETSGRAIDSAHTIGVPPPAEASDGNDAEIETLQTEKSGRAIDSAHTIGVPPPAEASDGNDAEIETLQTETSGWAADSAHAISVSSPTVVSDGADARVETLQNEASTRATKSACGNNGPTTAIDGNEARVEKSKLAIYEHVTRYCSYYRNNERAYAFGDGSSVVTRGCAAKSARATYVSSPAMVSYGNDARAEILQTETTTQAAKPDRGIDVSSHTMASDGDDAQVEIFHNKPSGRAAESTRATGVSPPTMASDVDDARVEILQSETIIGANKLAHGNNGPATAINGNKARVEKSKLAIYEHVTRYSYYYRNNEGGCGWQGAGGSQPHSSDKDIDALNALDDDESAKEDTVMSVREAGPDKFNASAEEGAMKLTNAVEDNESAKEDMVSVRAASELGDDLSVEMSGCVAEPAHATDVSSPTVVSDGVTDAQVEIFQNQISMRSTKLARGNDGSATSIKCNVARVKKSKLAIYKHVTRYSSYYRNDEWGCGWHGAGGSSQLHPSDEEIITLNAMDYDESAEEDTVSVRAAEPGKSRPSVEQRALQPTNSMGDDEWAEEDVASVTAVDPENYNVDAEERVPRLEVQEFLQEECLQEECVQADGERTCSITMREPVRESVLAEETELRLEGQEFLQEETLQNETSTRATKSARGNNGSTTTTNGDVGRAGKSKVAIYEHVTRYSSYYRNNEGAFGWRGAGGGQPYSSDEEINTLNAMDCDESTKEDTAPARAARPDIFNVDAEERAVQLANAMDDIESAKKNVASVGAADPGKFNAGAEETALRLEAQEFLQEECVQADDREPICTIATREPVSVSASAEEMGLRLEVQEFLQEEYAQAEREPDCTITKIEPVRGSMSAEEMALQLEVQEFLQEEYPQAEREQVLRNRNKRAAKRKRSVMEMELQLDVEEFLQEEYAQVKREQTLHSSKKRAARRKRRAREMELQLDLEEFLQEEYAQTEEERAC